MKEFIITEKQDLQEIADAIRGKTGKTATMTVLDMAAEIAGIEGETDLSDIVALLGDGEVVEGSGSGGGTGSLDGLKDGWDVMFYDENNEGLAFYSIKKGHTIEAPVYNCKAWQTEDGTNVVFPYTPTEDVIFYANNSTYASTLYAFYGVDSAVYPYVSAYIYSNENYAICFAKTYNSGELSGGCIKNSNYVVGKSFEGGTIQEFVSAIMSAISPSDIATYSSGGQSLSFKNLDKESSYVADNVDHVYTKTTNVYDLNQ